MKYITLLIAILFITGCSQQLGSDLVIKNLIDKKVIPINKIHTSKGELKVENTDENENETFIIKSDKNSYSGDGNIDVIVSVTNLRKDEVGTLKLKYSKGEKIKSVSKYIPVNSTREVPIYSDVEVKCGLKASSTPCYKNIQTATTTEDYILDTWESIGLKDKIEKTNILKKETKGKYDDKDIEYLFPKGTTFLKVNIEYENKLGFEDKFYIEVFGENGGYGMLDPLITDIVSYYKLDGNSDDAVTTNDGTDTSITYSNANGIINNGAGLASASNSKIVSTLTGISGTVFSYSLWFKTSTTGANQTILAHYESNPAQLMILINTSNHVVISTWNGSSDPQVVTTGTYTDGDWHHLVAVKNGGSGEIYIDGSSVKTGSPNNNTITTNFVIGRDGVNNANSFNGAIDEVGIWEKVLTSTEVTELYNSGLACQYNFTNCPTLTSRRIINIQ